MKSLEVLTDGLFDYAGMFPPAALSFEDMLEESARFPDSLTRPDLVGNDLVLTSQTLDRLDQGVLDASGFEHDRLCRICLVGVDAREAASAARRVLRFNRDRHGEPTPQHITNVEFHVEGNPREVIGELREAADLLGHAVHLYLEPKWTDAEWNRHLGGVLGALDRLATFPVGLKVRCAGPNAVEPATLARIMRAVASRRLPLKLTQGLHHALPGPGHPHGFVNVAVAFRLAPLGLGETDLEALLAERDMAAFDFSYGVRWREWHLPLKQLGEAKRQIPFAIGSCSIGEPDEELQQVWPAAQ